MRPSSAHLCQLCAAWAFAALLAAPALAAKPVASTATVEALNAQSLVAGRGGAGNRAIGRAQVLLDRAGFSPGEIDGRNGRNLVRALSAFQMANGLKVSGRLDAVSARALEQGDPGEAFTTYAITAQDVAGPFTTTPADMTERSKLKSLDYENLHEALAERFHLSEAMLSSLNRGVAKTYRAGDRLIVPDVTQRPLAGAAALIEIDKSAKTMWVLDAQRKVLAAFPISIGGPQDPLPVGTLKIVSEVANPTFTYDPAILKNAPPGAGKVEIRPGPNNPVGTMWLGLDKPHWGIHGTPSPSKLGREETNGCIHLTNWDANRLAKLVKPGVTVNVKS